MSLSCEALIFAFLGLSTVRAFSDGKKWDLQFAAITVVACFVCRFIGVFLLSAAVNPCRMEKINKVDQFIMGYGGLRGAVCYGLVMSVDSESEPLKEVFVTTTVIVIALSVFLQGTTMKPIVELLRVKKVDEQKGTVAQLIMNNIEDHMMAGIEGVIGHHGHFWVRRKLTQIDSNMLAPLLMRNPPSRTTKLLKKYEEESVAEARNYIQKHGSFAGLEASKHMCPSRDSRANTFQGETGDISRNESLSRILERNLPPPPLRKKSNHIYNRTTLGSEDDLRRYQAPQANRRPPTTVPQAPLLAPKAESIESAVSTPDSAGEHIRFFLDSNELCTPEVREGRATSVATSEVIDETRPTLDRIDESDEKENV
uniref:Na_H_Exchanger domain-containing protein n=1 Tax=Steinernema glaseri TaxID=37863 RepID=A0A1I7Z2Z1_9BILA